MGKGGGGPRDFVFDYCFLFLFLLLFLSRRKSVPRDSEQGNGWRDKGQQTRRANAGASGKPPMFHRGQNSTCKGERPQDAM